MISLASNNFVKMVPSKKMVNAFLVMRIVPHVIKMLNGVLVVKELSG